MGSTRNATANRNATLPNDDVELYTDESREEVLKTFHFIRQQTERSEGKYNRALCDFVAPKETGIEDYMGFFAVTALGARLGMCPGS